MQGLREMQTAMLLGPGTREGRTLGREQTKTIADISVLDSDSLRVAFETVPALSSARTLCWRR